MKWLVWFALALAVRAQEPRYAVQSRLVIVPVTVTDTKGRLIEGLDPKDFVVLDNGRPQRATVDTTATGVAPIALVVAVQTSGISKPVLEKLPKVAAMFQPMLAGDGGCTGLVTFSDRVTWLHECTGDEGAVTRAFELIHAEEPKGARMLDAVQQAIERLSKKTNSRRVLLLISETRDRGSDATLQQVAMAAQNSEVTVYAVTYSAFRSAFTTRSSAIGDPHPPKIPTTPSEKTGTLDGDSPHCAPGGCPQPPVPLPDQRVDLLGALGELMRLGKTNTTQALAQGTGGATLPFTRLKGLEESIEKLGSELHSQYVLSFTPDDRTPGYHQLEIQVERRGLRIRSRPGYWSAISPGQ